MAFDDLKVRTKILVPLVGMAVVFSGVTTIGAIRLNDLTHRYNEITGGADPSILRLNRAARLLNEIGRDVYAIVVYDRADPRARKVETGYVTAKRKADQSFDEAAKLNPANADRYRAFKDRFDAIYEETKAPKAIADAVPGLAAGAKLTPAELDQMAVAAKEMESLDTDINDFSSQIMTFNHNLEDGNDATVIALKQQSGQTIVMMIGLGLLAILGGLGVSTWVSSAKVTGPLARLGDRMKGLAQGELAAEIEGQDRGDEVGIMAKAVQVFKDNALKTRAMEAEAQALREAAEAQRLAADRERAVRAAELARVVDALAGGLGTLADGVLTHRLNEAFDGEYEQLRQDFNAAMSKVESALSAVFASAQGIGSGAGEISQAADDLSRRTEQQAASLEETAAALDEITATIRKTAENAQHAREVVSKAKGDAHASGVIVDDAIKAMSAIERSSSSISQIIGVIDEIAFQTNLLALNAGVEAARAGDAGRGFAVVAQEVRALAQRSAEAAKEIKSLISTSAREVGNGVELVGEAGKALQRIADQVAEINSIVEDITHSTQEQATGLAQVNTAVNQMDQMTQQNAAMVEESTAASHSLAQEAETLNGLTQGFQVSGSSGRGASAREAKAPKSANLVHAQRGRIAASLGRSNEATAVAAESWEEF